MQAIILAAGTGSRLGSLTKSQTKCMITINGERLIDLSLRALMQAGIKKVIIVVGYQGKNLIDHIQLNFKDSFEFEFVENSDYATTNNIYSLFLARKFLLEDDTILLESDLIFDPKILLDLISDSRTSLAAVDKFKSWMDGTCVSLDDDDNIVGFYGKKAFKFTDIETYYKTVNIYKFSRLFSSQSYVPFLEAYSKAKGNNEYYESVLKLLTVFDSNELKAFRLNNQNWYEIDDIQDRSNAEVLFASSPSEKLNLLQSRYGGYWRFPKLIDYCYLVNPYFPPIKLLEEIKSSFCTLISQYPSGIATQNLLSAKMFAVESNNILVANGAAEIISVLAMSIPGKFGIMMPTFNEYPHRIGLDRLVTESPVNESFSYGLDALIKLADKCDNLILVNPDNPSGNFIEYSDVIRLAEYTKQQSKLLILDESFVDFF